MGRTVPGLRAAAALLLLFALATGPLARAVRGQESGGGSPGSSSPGGSSLDTDTQMILAAGPTAGRELPFLGPNVVRYWRGRYEFQGREFLVYFTRDAVFGILDWSARDCRGWPARVHEIDADGPRQEPSQEIWHFAPGAAEDAAWHLFVLSATDARDGEARDGEARDGEAAPLDFCGIMPPFLSRLVFFLEALPQGSRDAPLPAVVEIAAP